MLLVGGRELLAGGVEVVGVEELAEPFIESGVETAVGEMLGSAFTHHGGRYSGASGKNRIPDFASGNDLVEVKYTNSLSKTKQITDYAQRVDDIKGTLTIYTKDTTKLSGPLQDLIAQSGGRIEVVKCL